MTTPSAKRDRSRDRELVGTTIAGKYRVLDLLGQGGFGSVFLVEIVAGMVGEKLALKLIPPELSGEEKIKAQFLNEIRVAMRMVNKYIVQIRDVGETESGQLYYTMDYCPGESLAEVIQREGAIAPGRAIPIALRILEALKTAHAAGVIHRDLKPANVMVFPQDGHETCRVLDFGIATAIGAARTGGKKFVGSPHYMPPEQFLNEELGYYTDTYAVGAILFECLTGQRPYQGRTAQEVFNDLKSRPVTPPEELAPELATTPGLSDLVRRALERNPDHRYGSARDFFNDLKAILEGKGKEETPPAAPARGRRRSRSGAAARAAKSGSSAGIVAAIAVAVIGGGILVAVLKNPGGPAEGVAGAPAATPGKTGTPVDPAPAGNPTPGDPTSAGEATPIDSTGSLAPSPLIAPASGSFADSKKFREEKAAEAQAALEKRREAEEEKHARALATARSRLQEAIEAAKGAQWDRARESASDAVQVDPTLGQGFRVKGQAELKLGLFQEALNSLQEARGKDASGKPDPVLLGEILEAIQGIPGYDPNHIRSLSAEAVEAIAKAPPSVEATQKILLLLEALGDETRILAILKTAGEQKLEGPVLSKFRKKYLEDLPRERLEKAQGLLAEARKAFEAGNFDLARQKAQEGIGNHPLAELHFVLAETLLETGKSTEALEVLRGAGGPVGEDGEAIVRLGILFSRSYLALQAAGDVKTEKKPLERALENLDAAAAAVKDVKGKGPILLSTVRTYRARCYALQGDFNRTDGEVKAAKSVMDAALVFHQAESYYLCGMASKGTEQIHAFKTAISRINDYLKWGKDTGKDPRAFRLLGLCYLRQGGAAEMYRKACDSFQKAVNLGMKEGPEILEPWAEAHLGLGDYTQAGQKYRNSFRIQPTVALCIKSTEAFINANQHRSAVEMLNEGLAKFPKDPNLQNRLNSIRR